MKELFPGYYKPHPGKLREMWSTGLISLDTNVLLDVFRVSEETAGQLLNTLERLQPRLWLPFHVAQEYHVLVDSVVAEQAKPYEETVKRLDSLLATLVSSRSHPFVDDALLTDTKTLFDRLNSALTERRKRLESLLNDNPLKERISTIFEGCVGEQLSAEELTRIYEKGAVRFDQKVPPGYADKDKPEPERYGDLIIWESFLAKLAGVNKPGLLVTSDTKEDWFLRISGKTIGPRPELIAEMRLRAGVDFYLYATPGFLRYANEFLNAGIAPDAIREVQDLETARIKRIDGPHSDLNIRVHRAIAILRDDFDLHFRTSRPGEEPRYVDGVVFIFTPGADTAGFFRALGDLGGNHGLHSYPDGVNLGVMRFREPLTPQAVNEAVRGAEIAGYGAVLDVRWIVQWSPLAEERRVRPD